MAATIPFSIVSRNLVQAESEKVVKEALTQISQSDGVPPFAMNWGPSHITFVMTR